MKNEQALAPNIFDVTEITNSSFIGWKRQRTVIERFGNFTTCKMETPGSGLVIAKSPAQSLTFKVLRPYSRG